MKRILRKVLFVALGAGFLASHLEAAVPVLTEAVPVTANPVSNERELSAKDAIAEFKSLSRKERRSRIKEVKQVLKEYKKEKRQGNEPSSDRTLQIILAILLPPLAVYLHEGVINNKFWISLLLTLLFWLPGVIYALVVVLDKDN